MNYRNRSRGRWNNHRAGNRSNNYQTNTRHGNNRPNYGQTLNGYLETEVKVDIV